jgi:hypothetical protein
MIEIDGSVQKYFWMLFTEPVTPQAHAVMVRPIMRASC